MHCCLLQSSSMHVYSKVFLLLIEFNGTYYHISDCSLNVLIMEGEPGKNGLCCRHGVYALSMCYFLNEKSFHQLLFAQVHKTHLFLFSTIFGVQALFSLEKNCTERRASQDLYPSHILLRYFGGGGVQRQIPTSVLSHLSHCHKMNSENSFFHGNCPSLSISRLF